MKTVEVEILGKKYYIKSNNPDELLKHAEYLGTQLEELNEKFNTVDQSKLFVLHALILIENYFNELEINKNLSGELKQLNELLNKFEDEI